MRLYQRVLIGMWALLPTTVYALPDPQEPYSRRDLLELVVGNMCKSSLDGEMQRSLAANKISPMAMCECTVEETIFAVEHEPMIDQFLRYIIRIENADDRSTEMLSATSEEQSAFNFAVKSEEVARVNCARRLARP